MKQQTRNKALPKRRGVTLIEIAIVLVIIGILLGGVLKGQELINNARVRALADQQNSLKVAWFAFLDRFGGMPADYVFAEQYIRGTINGNGDGIITEGESTLALQQLAASGYLRCQQCTTKSPVEVAQPTQQNALLNSYSGIMGIFHNGHFEDGTTTSNPANYTFATDEAAASSQPRLMIHSGRFIPSNIAAQIDLKVDDGIANRGEIVFNQWVPGSGATLGSGGPPLSCMTSDRTKQADATNLFLDNADLYWRHADASPQSNCGLSNNL